MIKGYIDCVLSSDLKRNPSILGFNVFHQLMRNFHQDPKEQNGDYPEFSVPYDLVKNDCSKFYLRFSKTQ